MTTLDNLESALLASRKVSDFLKNFSPSQWTRILKATIVLGVQELERVAGTGDCQALNQLYPKDIEDIVVKNEEVNSMHVFIHVQQYEYVDVNIWIDMHMNVCVCVYGYICISYHTYYTYYIMLYIYTYILM